MIASVNIFFIINLAGTLPSGQPGIFPRPSRPSLKCSSSSRQTGGNYRLNGFHICNRSPVFPGLYSLAPVKVEPWRLAPSQAWHFRSAWHPLWGAKSAGLARILMIVTIFISKKQIPCNRLKTCRWLICSRRPHWQNPNQSPRYHSFRPHSG